MSGTQFSCPVSWQYYDLCQVSCTTAGGSALRELIFSENLLTSAQNIDILLLNVEMTRSSLFSQILLKSCRNFGEISHSDRCSEIPVRQQSKTPRPDLFPVKIILYIQHYKR